MAGRFWRRANPAADEPIAEIGPADRPTEELGTSREVGSWSTHHDQVTSFTSSTDLEPSTTACNEEGRGEDESRDGEAHGHGGREEGEDERHVGWRGSKYEGKYCEGLYESNEDRMRRRALRRLPEVRRRQAACRVHVHAPPRPPPAARGEEAPGGM